jgi:formamidopyrimidine-DNA glycosylase
LFDLDNGRTLITHLRMSGKFLLLNADIEDPKFAHAVLYLDRDERLVFQDQRHFGLMKIVPTRQLGSTRELAKLAPEPFSDEFSSGYLFATLRSSRRSLKEFLLDQTKVCGLGNIYASEVMFLAKVNPRIAANRVSRTRAAKLHINIRAVLDEAVSLLSRTPLDAQFIGEGVYGEGPDSRWRVYDREHEDCPECRQPIFRITQAGRSTYFCKQCQRR